MDPFTAFLLALAEGFKLATAIIESQPPDLRGAVALRLWEDGKPWRDLADRFRLPQSPS